MPKRNRNLFNSYGKKRRKTRRFFKRKRKSNRNILSNIAVSTTRFNPIPPIYRTVLRTNLTGVISDLGTAGIGIYAVKMNSMVDPWFTAQPFPNPKLPSGITLQTLRPAGLSNFMGYVNEVGQINSLYTIARVLASAVKVTVVPPANYINTESAIITNYCQVSVTPVRNTLFASGVTAAQGPHTKTRLVTAYDTAPINNYCKVMNFAGMTREKLLGDDTMRFSLTTDPTDLMYWEIVVEKTASGNLSANAQLSYNVTIDYYVQFEEPYSTNLADVDIVDAEAP